MTYGSFLTMKSLLGMDGQGDAFREHNVIEICLYECMDSS